MKEVLEQILSQIPEYILNFGKLLAMPIKFMRDHNKGEEPPLTQPFIFLGISLVLTFVIRVPMLQNDVNTLGFIAADALWKIVIILIVAAAMKIAWQIVGGRATFQSLLVANCYYFGVFSVITHLLLLSGRYLDPSRVINLVIFREQFTPNAIIKTILYSIGFGAIIVWCLVCWGAYHELNGRAQVSASGSFLAFVLFIIISFIPLAFGAAIRQMLIGPSYY